MDSQELTEQWYPLSLPAPLVRLELLVDILDE
jgi:hypothetical protein